MAEVTPSKKSKFTHVYIQSVDDNSLTKLQNNTSVVSIRGRDDQVEQQKATANRFVMKSAGKGLLLKHLESLFFPKLLYRYGNFKSSGGGKWDLGYFKEDQTTSGLDGYSLVYHSTWDDITDTAKAVRLGGALYLSSSTSSKTTGTSFSSGNQWVGQMMALNTEEIDNYYKAGSQYSTLSTIGTNGSSQNFPGQGVAEKFQGIIIESFSRTSTFVNTGDSELTFKFFEVIPKQDCTNDQDPLTLWNAAFTSETEILFQTSAITTGMVEGDGLTAIGGYVNRSKKTPVKCGASPLNTNLNRLHKHWKIAAPTVLKVPAGGSCVYTQNYSPGYYNKSDNISGLVYKQGVARGVIVIVEGQQGAINRNADGRTSGQVFTSGGQFVASSNNRFYYQYVPVMQLDRMTITDNSYEGQPANGTTEIVPDHTNLAPVEQNNNNMLIG